MLGGYPERVNGPRHHEVARTFTLVIAIIASVLAFREFIPGRNWPAAVLFVLASAVNYWLAWDGIFTIEHWLERRRDS